MKRNSGTAVIGVLLAVFVLVFAVSAYKLGDYFLKNRQASSSYESLRAQAVVPEVGQNESTAVSAAPGDGSGNTVEEGTDTQKTAAQAGNGSMDFSALQAVNPDIKGWITCEGTDIDYPILQGEDNDYYLYRLYTGAQNANGSIFMDYRNESIDADKNVVIYGHRMYLSGMFHDLANYESQSFYDEHPTMMLYTPEGDYRIELISGTVENGDEEFIQFDFSGDADFLSYVSALRARSCFTNDVAIEAGDRIISLCTCTYEIDNGRFMVVGKLVPVSAEEN